MFSRYFKQSLYFRITLIYSSVSFRNQHLDKPSTKRILLRRITFCRPQLAFIVALLLRKRCELTITACSGLVKERGRRVECLGRNLFLGGKPQEKRNVKKRRPITTFGGLLVTSYRQCAAALIDSRKFYLLKRSDILMLLIESTSMSLACPSWVDGNIQYFMIG